MDSREIKFRGKCKRTGQWMLGYLSNKDVINQVNAPRIKVDSKTVGQFTGLKDKNGKDLYEGDIVQFGDSKAKIEWGSLDLCYIFWYEKHKEWYGITFLKGYKAFEVIGNIHDNPDLLR